MFVSGFSMFQPIVDTFLKNLSNLLLSGSRNIFPDDITTQREREAGNRFPPGAEVERQFEPLASVGDLAFMNDQTNIRLTCLDELKNLVKRNRDYLHFRRK